MYGKFIVLEGLEGAGKTTAQKIIKKILHQNGIKKVILIREPGSTKICEKLRKIVKNDKITSESITEKAEILIFYAARIQLINTVIKPSLLKGYWVIGDRHDMSTLAYQGFDISNKEIYNLIKFLRKNLLKNFQPDLTIYLDINPQLGLHRINHRNKPLDRIEKKSINFFLKVHQKYLKIIKNNKKTKIINATKNIKKVTQDLFIIIQKWFFKR